MRKIIAILALLSIAGLASCSGGEPLVEVGVTTAQRPVIPAAATSCLAIHQAKDAASTTVPTADITAAYFSIPQMTFTPLHTNRDIYISYIKIEYSLPNSTGTVTCELGGDGLAALKDSWWSSSPKEAKIAAGASAADMKTDCPVYCGGIDKDLPPFSSTATITVYGYEQNPSDVNDATGFTTTGYVTFGKQ